MRSTETDYLRFSRQKMYFTAPIDGAITLGNAKSKHRPFNREIAIFMLLSTNPIDIQSIRFR